MTWTICLIPILLGLMFQRFVPTERFIFPERLKSAAERLGVLRRKLFQSSESRSQALINVIFVLERGLQSGGATGHIELPEYKTYTSLLNDLLSSQRRYGVPLRDALKQLREFLRQEGRFSRKWDEEKRGGLVQLILMSLISWVFIKVSLSILEVELAWWMLSFLGGAHFLGLFVYRQGLSKIALQFFEKLIVFQEVIFRFRVYRRSGLPTKTILKEVAPGDLESHGGVLLELREQLFELIHQWREKGVAIEEELKGLEDEVGLRLELARDRALKWEKALRLLVLILFYVIPYLSYLFFLLGSLSSSY